MTKDNYGYKKKIGDGSGYGDVYDVLVAFEVPNPATQHAIKKLLKAGSRGGGKDRVRDLTEARDAVERAIDIDKCQLRALGEHMNRLDGDGCEDGVLQKGHKAESRHLINDPHRRWQRDSATILAMLKEFEKTGKDLKHQAGRIAELFTEIC